MPLPAQLDIYKASAGSGKTFLLTIQYLQLLFEKPSNYQHILAVTFTNKATAEMKERILGELENLARGKEIIDGKQNVYAAKLLAAMPGYSFEQLHQQAKKIYSAILHDYSRFAVTTIDSFVQRIIRSFAYEIGLDAGFKLQLNTDIVKEDLADRLFKLLDEDNQLRDWVAAMAISKLQEGKNWNFRSDMVQLSGELFKEKFQEFDDALKQIPNVHETFSVLRDKVFATTNAFEKQWDEYCSQGMKIISDAGLTVIDFPYKAGSFAGIFNKSVNDVAKGIPKRVAETLEDPDKMYAKTMEAGVRSRIQNIGNILHTHLSRMVSFFREEIINYNTASAINRNLRTLRLMHVFGEQLSNYRSENNELLISDTHLLLRQLTQDTEASFIYEKIGNQFQHYLIDEFQDTSSFQWDNFRPLLENTLAEGNYSLLVGDIKQAIYRWRNGDWRLLLEKVEEQLSSFQITEHSLQDNRRSAKPVIHFNNYLFNVAPHLLQEEMTTAINEAPLNVRQKLIENGYDKIIEEAYKNSYQFIPETASENGQAQIRFIESKDENGEKLEYDDIVLPQLHETILELLQQGYAAKDIAILTRKNDEARTIIEYLMNAQQADSAKYDLLSAEALLLEKNDAVSIIIAAIQLLANNSKLALVQLRQRVVHYKKMNAPSYDIFIRKAEDENILPAEFYNNTTSFRQLALPEMVNAVIRIFQLHEESSNAAYLLALQDMVGEWSRYGEEGLLHFLRYWEEERGKKSLPGGANTNAIEVLTIHKSKGLAFTVLLMPYLNWKLKPDATKSIQLWVKTAGTNFNNVPVVPVRYAGVLEQSAFAYDYFEEYLLGVMDSLNMLYVAFTRARNRIIGWAPKPAKTDGIGTIDKLLCMMANEKIAGNNITIMPVHETYDASSGLWTYGEAEHTIESKEIMEPALMPPLVQTNWKQKLSIRYKPLQTEEQQVLHVPRQQGVLLHEALALLQHPSQLDHTINRMMLKGLMTESQQAHTKDILAKVFSQPLLDGWKNNTMQRLSEREIITPARQLRRPDLVLYNSEETLVIDFKFSDDKKDLQHHKEQVLEYMQLLQQLNFSGVSGYVLYAMLGEVESVKA